MSVSSGYFESLARFCAVYFVMLLIFLMSQISFATPFSTTIEIPFMIMMLFYWSVYRPTLLPPVLVFLIGVCADIMAHLPFGISAFILLFVRQLVIDQRIFLTGQPFTVIWLGFSIVSTLALFLQWILFGVISWQFSEFFPVVLSAIAAILLFPVIALILNLSHKLLPILPDQYSAVRS